MTHEPSATRWRGAEYAHHAGHHRALDEWFLGRHRPRPGDVVVDLGCGTGEFTARLAALASPGQVIGVDNDASMLERARRQPGDNLRFVQSAAERVDEVLDPGSADLVVSRAMLHWLPEGARAVLFRAARRVLRPGGWLHTESAAAGNVRRVVAVLADLAERHGLPPPPTFPDPAAVLEELEAEGYEVPQDGVRSVAQRRGFDAEELEGFLRSQATVALTRDAPADLAATLVEEAVASMDRLRRHDGSLDQTFVRLDVLARRPD